MEAKGVLCRSPCRASLECVKYSTFPLTSPSETPKRGSALSDDDEARLRVPTHICRFDYRGVQGIALRSTEGRPRGDASPSRFCVARMSKLAQ
jgi:hypothetical protein